MNDLMPFCVGHWFWPCLSFYILPPHKTRHKVMNSPIVLQTSFLLISSRSYMAVYTIKGQSFVTRQQVEMWLQVIVQQCSISTLTKNNYCCHYFYLFWLPCKFFSPKLCLVKSEKIIIFDFKMQEIKCIHEMLLLASRGYHFENKTAPCAI